MDRRDKTNYYLDMAQVAQMCIRDSFYTVFASFRNDLSVVLPVSPAASNGV